MGNVVSIVNNIMDSVQKIKSDKKKDKLNNDLRKKADIIKPIKPPKYYNTIEARRKNVKDGPYSVEGIAQSLKNDLVPVGYSLEQLRKIGFGADVTEYEKRQKQEKDNDKKILIDGLTKLKKEFKKGFIDRDDLSEEDKKVLRKNGLFDQDKNLKYVVKIEQWINLTKQDALSIDVLENMIAVFNLKLDGYQDALRDENLRQQNQAIIDNAVLNRDKKILDSVKRAFSNGYGIKKF